MDVLSVAGKTVGKMAREDLLAQSMPAAQPRTLPHAGWWGRLRRHLRTRRARQDAAHALYMALVEQARSPFLYERLGVPDSRDGRLELVGLHTILLLHRLRPEGAPGQETAQALFDLLFADLDRHMREWGVGDLSVGKQVRKLAETFFARLTAVAPLLGEDRPGELEAVLRRNVYSEVAEPDPAGVAGLAIYLRAQHGHLAAQDGAALIAGRVTFLPAAGVPAYPPPA